MSKVAKAYDLYQNYIYDSQRIALLEDYNLKIPGSVPSVVWELFGAILTGKKGAGLIGADLVGWEVKSAVESGSYEYQYHLKTGEAKLLEDCHVNHLFISYSRDYKNVTVHVIPGHELADKYFNSWLPEYRENYNESVPSTQRRQRFRKSINFSYVRNNGTRVMEIKDNKLVFENEVPLDSIV